MINQDTVDFINEAETNELVVDEFRENFLTYSKVLNEGKFTLKQYVNAVKFTTYKMLDYNDSEAFILTFPEKYDRLKVDYAHDDEKFRRLISSYANRFKSSKLVVQIMQQTIVPSYIYNAPLFQEALLEATKIMKHSKSDIARVNAIAQILNHTKAPEEQNVNLNIGLKDNETVSDLRDMVEELSDKQREMMKQGVSPAEIAQMKILPAKYEEVEE